LKSSQIRNDFINYFKERGHKHVRSNPVIPIDDPTIMFTNAGMNQFKEIFLGKSQRDYTRAVNLQKCIRVSGKHNDLEEVGLDTSHHTFFEMMGNWSFGDYYKKEAIEWGWELLTGIWELPKKQLYATVYLDDAEAEELWKNITDIDHSHVQRFGEKDNFWEMGEVGPCGPCSEIHLDRGEHLSCGPECGVNCPCGRFIELWNLVFIQYNRDSTGKLHELPAKHVDTGMGFERITAVLQGKNSNYDTDIFEPVIERIEELTGKTYKEYEENEKESVAVRVIADHIRALTFAITDGALPSNEGRGYVLRRILRRAVRYGRNLNKHEPFIYKVTSAVVDSLGYAYPEIKERCEYVAKVIKGEEESFEETIDRGIEFFESESRKTLEKNEKVLSGKSAFYLHDTLGFPVDLTQLMAREKGLTVDMEEFQKLMDEQKKRSKAHAVRAFDEVEGEEKREHIPKEVTFLEQACSTETKIFSIFNEKNEPVEKVEKGERIKLFLEETPFYAESGGQVGDTGFIMEKGGKSKVRVDGTHKFDDQKIIHSGEVLEGTVTPGLLVTAEIDYDRRLNVMRNHTVTHLLHKVLREVLGKHVRQSGSLVAPDYLRFDFNHFDRLTDQEIDVVERKVNELIRQNIPVSAEREVDFKEALDKGAIAIFGEKYEDKVRMVSIGDESRELCGGTHLRYTGEAGYFRIISEGSVASGIRRIVAVTGDRADQIIREEKKEIHALREMLQAQEGEAPQKLRNILEEKKELEKELEHLRMDQAGSFIMRKLEETTELNGVKLIAEKIDSGDVDYLKNLGDVAREMSKNVVAVFGTVTRKKVNFVCVVGDELIKNKKLRADDIIKEVAAVVGGGGGGKAHLATAGGKDTKKIDEALKLLPAIVKKRMLSENI